LEKLSQKLEEATTKAFLQIDNANIRDKISNLLKKFSSPDIQDVINFVESENGNNGNIASRKIGEVVKELEDLFELASISAVVSPYQLALSTANKAANLTKLASNRKLELSAGTTYDPMLIVRITISLDAKHHMERISDNIENVVLSVFSNPDNEIERNKLAKMIDQGLSNLSTRTLPNEYEDNIINSALQSLRSLRQRLADITPVNIEDLVPQEIAERISEGLQNIVAFIKSNQSKESLDSNQNSSLEAKGQFVDDIARCSDEIVPLTQGIFSVEFEEEAEQKLSTLVEKVVQHISKLRNSGNNDDKILLLEKEVSHAITHLQRKLESKLGSRLISLGTKEAGELAISKLSNHIARSREVLQSHIPNKSASKEVLVACDQLQRVSDDILPALTEFFENPEEEEYSKTLAELIECGLGAISKQRSLMPTDLDMIVATNKIASIFSHLKERQQRCLDQIVRTVPIPKISANHFLKAAKKYAEVVFLLNYILTRIRSANWLLLV
jgi:hypothetical protein